ncbi:MAG TPA: aminoglycoside phosphotransferase family protein [Acidimicrobiales bacterium]|nr:aminoglycoside phosphotransferase family protein [Acidimicrobiales bacterium]|tara:strand:+ start:207 stop:1181 length:975 start_codon:yes stop_codon:yes gene_type:complete
MGFTFPTCPDELNSEWLSSALGRSVKNFETRPIGGGKGNLGDLVLVSLENGEQVVAKFAANRQEALSAAKRSGLFEREIKFYHELAPKLDLRLPKLFASAYDPSSAYFVMLLEYLEPIKESDSISGIGVDYTRQLLVELSKLHTQGKDLVETPWVQTMISQHRINNLTIMIEKGWPVLQEMCGEIVDPLKEINLLERFLETMSYLNTLDQTIVHGDIKPDNLIISNQGVTIIDWQGFGIGPPAWDIAYCMCQCLTTEERRFYESELLDSYPHDLVGYKESLFFGIVIACALSLLGNSDDPRLGKLVGITAERTISAMSDAGTLN